jgi:hypothetical protein
MHSAQRAQGLPPGKRDVPRRLREPGSTFLVALLCLLLLRIHKTAVCYDITLFTFAWLNSKRLACATAPRVADGPQNACLHSGGTWQLCSIHSCHIFKGGSAARDMLKEF